MDPELSGSETPGAILEFVKKEDKKDNKITKEKEEEKKEKNIKEEKTEKKVEVQNNENINQDSSLREIKKKIFDTDIFADRYKSGVNIARNDINKDELDITMIYDNEFFQKFYKDIVLSMPSNIQKWLEKIYTEGKGSYIGSIIGVEAKDKNEFYVKLGNNQKVIYDKKIIGKDKNKDIIEIMDYFSKAKFVRLWLILQQNNKNKEIYIKDYEDLSKTNKFKEKIREYKEKYKLTWYEFLLSAMGYNIYDLSNEERKLMDKLYVPRVLSLFPVWLPTADSLYNPYTHTLQLTPPSTGKTKFYLLLQGYLDIGYIQGIPTRARLVYHAEKDALGEIHFSEYLILDEIDKAESQEFVDFMKTMSEGLDSGRWSAEKGNAEKIREVMRGRRLPRGFIFLGNLGEEYANEMEQIKGASDIYKYDNARKAAKALLKEKAKGNSKYTNSIDALISRVGIVSVVPEHFNVNKIKANRILNPIAMHELINILQEEIDKIANNFDKYIDVEKIRQLGQFDDARLEENTKKIAVKIKALEIDKYLGRSVEELAVEIVNGTWEWPKNEKA
jgi:hypothetical protein